MPLKNGWSKGFLSHANGACIEVATEVGEDGKVTAILMRDSKHPETPPLRFTPAEWDAFAGSMAMGNFDQVTNQQVHVVVKTASFPLWGGSPDGP